MINRDRQREFLFLKIFSCFKKETKQIRRERKHKLMSANRWPFLVERESLWLISSGASKNASEKASKALMKTLPTREQKYNQEAS